MSKNVTLYNLLISCPSDVKDEVELIKAAVDEFNELYADQLDIAIKTKHWKKSSYAQSGGKPQKLLNEQIVNDCDAAVAIFWTKFGSPTDEYGSGTEEEIEIMLQSGKQVFMYFSDKPISPSQMNSEEYKQIQAFREKYKDRGIYFTYSSGDEFKKMFFAQLSMYFLSEKKIKEATIERVPELKLVGIDKDGNLSDEASVYSFVINTDTTMNQYLNKIRCIYQEIADANVGKRVEVNNNFFAAFTSPVDIDKEEREFITNVAKQLKIELPDNFFDLGNLNKNTLTSNPLAGPTLNGSSDEIQKYKKIKKLHQMISEALEWAPIEQAFSDKNCLRLAIKNCGKAIDEDVEITFEIPQKSLLTLNEFPNFKNNEMGYLLNDCDMSILFGINSTAAYDEYSESKRSRTSNYTPRSYGLPGVVPNYSDDFIDELNDVFCYSIYSSGENYIVKLKMDYIKHNTCVAFPSVLFIKGDVESIPYKITSKNSPDVVEGVINVQKM